MLYLLEKFSKASSDIVVGNEVHLLSLVIFSTFSGAVKVNNGEALTVFIHFKVHKVCQNVSTSPTLYLYTFRGYVIYTHPTHAL